MTFFGKPVKPCSDCVDGWCTMNCSTPLLPDEPCELDLLREENKRLRIMHRAFGAYAHLKGEGWRIGEGAALMDAYEAAIVKVEK